MVELFKSTLKESHPTNEQTSLNLDRTLSALPERRSFHGCGTALFHGDLFVIVAGGVSQRDEILRTVRGLNLHRPSSEWRPLGTLQTARHTFPTVAVLAGRLTVAGGRPDINLLAMSDVEVFDDEAGTWNHTGAQQLTRPRAGHNTGYVPKARCGRIAGNRRKVEDTRVFSKSPFDRQDDDNVQFDSLL